MIRVSNPYIDKNDAKSVHDSLIKGWVSSSGPNVLEFEKKFSNFVNQKYGFQLQMDQQP